MSVFLLTAVPLSFLLLVTLMGAGNRSKVVLFTPAIRGGLLALPVYALIARLEYISSVQYEPLLTLFLHVGVKDVIAPAVVALLGGIVFCWKLFSEESTDLFVGLAAFIAGFFTVFGVIEVVYPSHYSSVYDLFLIPVVRVGVMLLLAGLTTAVYREGSLLRVLWVLLGLLSFAVPAFVPTLFAMSYDLISVLVTVAYIGLALVGVYLLQTRYFRSLA